jgi:two-component sensor histidine kinase
MQQGATRIRSDIRVRWLIGHRTSLDVRPCRRDWKLSALAILALIFRTRDRAAWAALRLLGDVADSILRITDWGDDELGRSGRPTMSHDADVGFAWSGRREGEVGGERSEVRGHRSQQPSNINGEWSSTESSTRGKCSNVADHTGEALFAIGISWHNSFSGYKLLLLCDARGLNVTTSDDVRLEVENVDLRRLLEQAGIDAAEQKGAQRLQRLLLEELHHRVKNTLATVMAITSQSLRAAKSVEDGRRAIEHRLLALGRVHDLLLDTNWTSASLAAILKTATDPFDTSGAGRFFLQSSDIEVSSGAVLPLAMVLSECR